MRALPPSLPFFSPTVLIATWFGSGLSPQAPGTMGTLAALPFAWFIFLLGGWSALAIAAGAAFVVGLWATAGYIRDMAEKDPGQVVIDEVAGIWIALIPAGVDPVLFATGFVLFRVFDILKPWPISWLERQFSGAFGVMIDDILAGVFAAVGVYAVKVWLGG